VLDCAPEPQVLPDLVNAQYSLNISGPTLICQAIGYRSDFSLALGDTSVYQGCDLSDGLPIYPPVFPEFCCLSIANDHVGGSEEEFTLL
jgi:hypothetical protein